MSLITEAIGQLFGGIRIVKAFGMERREEETFDQKNEEFIRSTMKMNRAKLRGRSIQELLYNLGVAVLLGPDIRLDAPAGGPFLPATLAVLAGALCYALSTILSRLRPASDATTSAAATTTIGALTPNRG